MPNQFNDVEIYLYNALNDLYHPYFDISINQLYDILKNQNFKCAISGVPIFLCNNLQNHKLGKSTAVITLINQQKQYQADNIHWVHKTVDNMCQNTTTEEQLTWWASKIYYNSLYKNKPSWTDYYMNLAKMIASRSIDTSSKCGCVITDQNHRVLSIGYNGPIKNIDDSKVPMTRPEKYYWMSHAEQNAIMFCNGNMKNSIVYITSRPCAFCTRMLIQKEVSEIIHGTHETFQESQDKMDIDISEQMLSKSNIIVKKYTWPNYN